MSATGYSVDLWVGDWHTTFDQDDDADALLATAGALALAGLRVSWDSDTGTFPEGEQPHQLSLVLHVPFTSSTKPDVFQGQTVSVTITDPGWTSTDPLPAFVEFDGRITDCDATALRDGLAYPIVAVDHRGAFTEETVSVAFPGREPFNGLDVDVIRGEAVVSGTAPGEEDPPTSAGLWGRIARVFAATGLPFTWTVAEDYGASFGYFSAHDGSPLALSELLALTCRTGATRDNGLVTGKWPNATRVPCVVQEIATDPVTGKPTLDQYRQAVTHSSPFRDADPLPYVLASPAAPTVVRQLRADVDSWALAGFVLPASITDKGMTWRQDKAAHPTRIELDGELFTEFPATPADEATTPKAPGYVLVRDSIEQARGAAVSKQASVACYSIEYARDASVALLGNDYDAVPRWSVDEFTFYPAELPAGTSWPRMFNPRTPPAGRTWLDGPHALGRLVLMTGINPEWMPRAAGDMPGRLIGASVEIRPGGRIACTARVRHTIPFPNHGAVTFADLTAAGMGDRVPADFADLTAYDLWLTDAPTP